MTRILKALGLSVMVTLALAAAIATPAVASYHTSNAAATIYGVGPYGTYIMSTSGNNFAFECFESEFEIDRTGTVSEEGKTSTDLTVWANYATEGCYPWSVSTGSCHYRLEPPTTNAEADTAEATIGVVCNAGGHITISFGACATTIVPQTGVSKVIFHNETASGHVLATMRVTFVNVSANKSCWGGASTTATVAFEEDITISASSGAVSVT